MSDTAALAAEQAALVRALWLPSLDDAAPAIAGLVHSVLAGGPHHPHTGLSVYRANGLGLAARVLPAAYPVLARLVGADSMAALAKDLWRQHPPTDGDIGRWGGALPAFVRSSAALADVPYLADVAEAEWALHRAATAADAVRDDASFGLLASEPADVLTLRLGAGVALLRSPWPVASLIAAHQANDDAALARIAEAPQPEHTLVWRHGFQPRCRVASDAEAALVEALLRGDNLDAALALAQGLAFEAWLLEAVRSGLVVAADRRRAAD